MTGNLADKSEVDQRSNIPRVDLCCFSFAALAHPLMVTSALTHHLPDRMIACMLAIGLVKFSLPFCMQMHAGKQALAALSQVHSKAVAAG